MPVIYSTAYLTEPGDIAAVPHDSDRCMIPFRLWNHESMFVRITTAVGRRFVLRVGGWHKCEEPFNNTVFVPHWIMANLQPIEDGDEIGFEHVKHRLTGQDTEEIDLDEIYEEDEHVVVNNEPLLEPASRVVMRAHSSKFLDVDDPKEWLEGALQNMSVLVCPSTIPLSYLGLELDFDVVRIEPYCRLRAVHLIDTDVEIDFEPPVDYVPPVAAAPPPPIFDAAAAEPVVVPPPETFTGTGHKLGTESVPEDDVAARRAAAAAAAKRRAGAAGAAGTKKE